MFHVEHSGSDIPSPGRARVRGIASRRDLLHGAALAAVPLPAFGMTAGPDVVNLRVGDRATRMIAWRPAKARGVALLSTGHGSWPERYERLADLMTAEGFAVLAPTHVDSVRHPDRAKFSREASFPERLADLRAAADYGATAYPGLPVIAVGHSFGTLSAACLGGAMAKLGSFRNPRVRAVLGFSSPGRVPGLVGPDAYAALAVPILLVTGTADTVPGLVTDPADHLLPFDTVRGPAFALVEKGGGHELVADGAMLGRAAPAVQLFAVGYGLGEARERAALARWKAAPGDRFTIRGRA